MKFSKRILNHSDILATLFLAFIGSTLQSIAQDNNYAYTQGNFREAAIFKDTIDVSQPDIARINAVLFYLTNAERIEIGLLALSYHPLLEKAAQMHSNEMVKRNFFDHYNKYNSLMHAPKDRARLAGIINPKFVENIIESFVLQYTAGQAVYPGGKGIFRLTPDGAPIAPHTYLSLGEQMIHDWMNSPHHRANILSEDAVSLGCGTAFFLKDDFNDMPTIYATQNFQLYETVKVANP